MILGHHPINIELSCAELLYPEVECDSVTLVPVMPLAAQVRAINVNVMIDVDTPAPRRPMCGGKREIIDVLVCEYMYVPVRIRVIYIYFEVLNLVRVLFFFFFFTCTFK